VATRRLAVVITGDAKDVVRAAKDTEQAFEGVEDKAQHTGREVDDLSRKLKALGVVASVGLAGSLAASAKSITGLGLASAGAFAGLAAGAAGAVLAVGGIGIAFALLNEDVQKSFTDLGTHVKDSLKVATESFVPVMQGIAGDLRGLFDEVLPQLKPLFDAIAPLLGEFARNAMDAVRPLIPVFVDLVNAGMPIVKMIGDSLVPIAVVLADTLKPVIGALGDAAGMLVGPLVDAIKMILPALGSLLTTLVEVGGPVLSTLLTNLAPVVVMIGDVLGGMLAELGPQLGELIGKLVPPLAKFLETLTPLLPMIMDLAGTVLVALGDSIGPIVEALVPFLTILGEQLKPMFEELKPIIQDISAQLTEKLVQAIIDSTPAFLDLTEALIPLIPPLVELIGLALLLAASIPPPAIAMGQIIDKFEELYWWVQYNVIPVLANFIGTVQNLVSTVSGSFGGMWDGLKYGFRDAINWIIDRWNNLSFSIPSVSAFGQTLGGGRMDFPDVPRLHAGGTFRTPSPSGEGLALLRDGERVSMPGQASGGGPSVVVNVGGSVISERDLVQVVRSGLLQADRYGRGGLS
jgi:phage-related protein